MALIFSRSWEKDTDSSHRGGYVPPDTPKRKSKKTRRDPGKLHLQAAKDDTGQRSTRQDLAPLSLRSLPACCCSCSAPAATGTSQVWDSWSPGSGAPRACGRRVFWSLQPLARPSVPTSGPPIEETPPFNQPSPQHAHCSVAFRRGARHKLGRGPAPHRRSLTYSSARSVIFVVPIPNVTILIPSFAWTHLAAVFHSYERLISFPYLIPLRPPCLPPSFYFSLPHPVPGLHRWLPGGSSALGPRSFADALGPSAVSKPAPPPSSLALQPRCVPGHLPWAV